MKLQPGQESWGPGEVALRPRNCGGQTLLSGHGCLCTFDLMAVPWVLHRDFAQIPVAAPAPCRAGSHRWVGVVCLEEADNPSCEVPTLV